MYKMDSLESDIETFSNHDKNQNFVTHTAEMAEHKTAEEHSMFHYSLKLIHHACKCRDVECYVRHCEKIKRIVLHTKLCVRLDDCINCKHFVSLYTHHVENCKETECPVPFGQKDKISSSKRLSLRMKHLKLKLLKLKLEQRRLLSQRVTVMYASYAPDQSYIFQGRNFIRNFPSLSPPPLLPLQFSSSRVSNRSNNNFNPNWPSPSFFEELFSASENSVPQLAQVSEQGSLNVDEVSSATDIASLQGSLQPSVQPPALGIHQLLLVLRNPVSSEQYSQVLGVLKNNPRLMAAVKQSCPIPMVQQLEAAVSGGSGHVEAQLSVQPENRGWIEP